MPLGEVLQNSWTIVANRSQLKSLRLKSLSCVLQLHELRFTEGSPIGRTEEKEDSALRSLERLVGLFVTKLIRQSKCRSLLADLQANRRSNGGIGG